MKPLFIWAVICHDFKQKETYVMSAFQEKDDAIAEAKWMQQRATKDKLFGISALRLYRPNENVLP